MRSENRRLILAAAIAIATCLPFAGCKRGGADVSVVGSTSLQPFVEFLAEEYAKKNPDQVVDVQGGGSTAGLQALANHLAHIGMCSRSLKDDEAQRFTPIVIARDGLAIVVHSSNPVDSLTIQQLRDIFSGKITNWKEVGGKDELICPITREEGSGTRESFQNLVMAKDRISKHALVQESNGAVKELAKGYSAAIGYMSLGLVHHELKTLTIDGVEPTPENVLSEKYKLVRPFLFVVEGTPSPKAQRFIDFVLSTEGQRMLESEGLFRK